MLCPPLPLPRATRCLQRAVIPGLYLMGLLGLLGSGSATANTPPPSPAPASGQAQLLETARQWVAQRQQLPPDQVRFAALDSRVQVPACEQPLQLDYPFSSSRETVRVRCPSPPSWQLFLRVLSASSAAAALPAPVGAAAAATAPVAPVATRGVVVTRQLVPRGTLLEPAMLEVTERPALGLDPLALGSLKDVAQAEALRDIPAGTVLRSHDLKRAVMVRKGQSALLTVSQGPGLQITVRVEAQQDGHLGEQIRLKNTESGRSLSGVVTGPNAVRGLQN